MKANETFKQKRTEIEEQIKMLQAGLKKLDSDQSENSQDWGFVGNAGHIANLLSEALEFVEA